MKSGVRLLVIGAVLLAAAGVVAVVLPRLTAGPKLEVVDAPDRLLAAKYDAPGGLCPWRNPKSDMAALFPQATTSREDTLSLGRERLEVEKRLGRKPTAEDMGLQIHRVFQGDKPLGAVVARRVRGENGAIELVVAVNTEKSIVGVRVQRMREPEKVAALLHSEAFLSNYTGKTSETVRECGCDQVEITPEAAPSARAVHEGIRTALILLTLGDKSTTGALGRG
jgi:hypothetical protein